MLHAVVSLFDRKNDRIVRSIWKELERTFHLRGIYKTPYPHFSYQIASDYDLAKLESKLERIARKSKIFKAHASGLGIFSGLAPVLYIPVVRTMELSRFHESLWKIISPAASGIAPYYRPEVWTPHITLAQWDIDERNLPNIVGRLSARELKLEIKVDNLAIIFDDGTTQTVHSRFPFGSVSV